MNQRILPTSGCSAMGTDRLKCTGRAKVPQVIGNPATRQKGDFKLLVPFFDQILHFVIFSLIFIGAQSCRTAAAKLLKYQNNLHFVIFSLI